MPASNSRPPLHRRAGEGQQALQEHPATSSTSFNRRAHGRQHHQLFGQEHLQQRWLLRDQPCKQLHNRAVEGSKHAQLQRSTAAVASGNNTPKATSEMEQPLTKEEHATYRKMATMHDLHTARHPLCNTGPSKILDRTTNSRPAEVEAPTEVHQRNTTLQAVRETNSQDTHDRSNTWHPGLRRQQLGRMRNNEEIYNKVPDQGLWNNNPLRQSNTGNFSIERCGSRTLHNQHRSNRVQE